MLPIDEVTFSESLTAFCPECGSGDIKINDEPFLVDKMVVITMICNKCRWGFSVYVNILGESCVLDNKSIP